MDENAFWIAMWRTAGTAVTAISVVVAGCTMYGHARVTEMVTGGADPIKAYCAINGVQSAACGAAAVK